MTSQWFDFELKDEHSLMLHYNSNTESRIYYYSSAHRRAQTFHLLP